MEPPHESQGRAGWVALGILAAAILVAVAIVLDLGPFADGELAEAEFLSRGDEICAQAHEDFEALQKRPPRTAPEAKELTEELLEVARDELDAIADLNPPGSLEPTLGRYLRAREDGIELIRDGLAGAEDGDAAAYAEAQAKLASGQLERLELAERVGFSECSRVLFGREQLQSDAQVPAAGDPSAPPTIPKPPTGTP